MDILISSNLERLIYRIAGNDANKNAQFMASLAKDGKYTVTPEMKEKLSDFYGNYTSEKETAEVIKKLYEDTGYIIDTHTAVAAGVYDKYKEATGDTATKTVIASTASPFKFTRSVMDAIDPKYDSMTDFELVDELSKLGNVKVPNAIEEIRMQRFFTTQSVMWIRWKTLLRKCSVCSNLINKRTSAISRCSFMFKSQNKLLSYCYNRHKDVLEFNNKVNGSKRI